MPLYIHKWSVFYGANSSSDADDELVWQIVNDKRELTEMKDWRLMKNENWQKMRKTDTDNDKGKLTENDRDWQTCNDKQKLTENEKDWLLINDKRKLTENERDVTDNDKRRTTEKRRRDSCDWAKPAEGEIKLI